MPRTDGRREQTTLIEGRLGILRFPVFMSVYLYVTLLILHYESQPFIYS
jgi:hypothetical protein